MSQVLVEVKDLTKVFSKGGQDVSVLNGLNFTIREGETFCVVGESGCGKSTTGRVLAGLLKPTAGQVLFKGVELGERTRQQIKEFRSEVQMIHQDPYASLNPTHRIFEILSYPLYRHKKVKSFDEAIAVVSDLLKKVGLTPVEDFVNKYPHQLSGGQRQRVSVARALTVNPKFLVVDEATSMIDTSLRISLLDMLGELQKELGVSYFFITHDLALAKHFAWDGRIAVMYLGKIVELARAPQLVQDPQHPYTKALLSAIPEADPEITRTKERFELIGHEIPSLHELPAGCPFHPRCPWRVEGLCNVHAPKLMEINESCKVACHVAHKTAEGRCS